MVEFLARRGFEGMDFATLRIDPGHNVLDRTVFARGVHRLEDEKHGPLVLCVKLVLQQGKSLHALGERFLGAVLVFVVELERVTRIVIPETEVFSGGHPERVGQFVGFFDELVGFHGVGRERISTALRPIQTARVQASKLDRV